MCTPATPWTLDARLDHAHQSRAIPLAFEVAWTLSYMNVFTGWDVDVPITYADDFTGYKSALAGALNSLTGVGDHRVTVGVNLVIV